MNFFRENSIKSNLIRISMFTTVIALIFSSVILITNKFMTYRSTLLEDLTVKAKIIGSNCSAAITFNNTKDAAETLSALKASENIMLAIIYTPDGRIFGKYEKKQIEIKTIPPFQKEGHHFGINHLTLFQPILIENENIGTIFLRSDLIKYYKDLLRDLSTGFVVLLCSVAVAFFLLNKLQIRITNPLYEFSKTMKTVSENKIYTIRAPSSNINELRTLSEGFNQMIEEIRKRDVELDGHRKHLEEMVNIRTSELGHELTERRQAEAALISAKARLQHLLISSPAIIYSRKHDSDMVFTFLSDNMKNHLGYNPEEFIEDPKFWINHIHSDNVDQITAGENRLSSRGHNIHEYQFRHKDGSYLWLRDEMQLICDDKGEPLEIVGYWIDITEKKQAEEQLSHRAFYDQLTDLPNRALFNDRLHVLFEHRKRYKDYLFGVLFMDVDRFKMINDSLGHIIGDKLLVLIAQRLRKCIRSADTIARFGGDEFAVLLEDLKEKNDIYTVINRIQNEINLPFHISSHEIFSTVSIGIAISDTTQYIRPEEILRDADTAMYYAKGSGKACHMLFNPGMHAHAVKALQIETDLRRAVERKEFVLHYQPIVSMNENNDIIGFEALVRWQHPERGLIPPNDFIPLAEETGLIVPMGQWVLLEACRQMRAWQDKYPAHQALTVSVNISTKEFSQPNFVQLIEKALQETGLSPNSLKLEITESMIIENYDYASIVFQKLRKINVQIQIDDFGTGHSALNYMLHLPIDALKIDRSFVRKAAMSEDVKEVVRTIISLAHIMKMDVIAEGVETMTEVELFRDMNSEYAQGFFFSKPMDSKTVESHIFLHS
jgi:diguanylate cyclase (GGDEF)-like protein/PAS domain S-box-containing protein